MCIQDKAIKETFYLSAFHNEVISILQASKLDTSTSFTADDLEDILLDSKDSSVTTLQTWNYCILSNENYEPNKVTNIKCKVSLHNLMFISHNLHNITSKWKNNDI